MITVGQADGFKCWDVALPKLHSGDEVTLECPSYLSYGGAHTRAQGTFTIPYNEPVKFELEILSCNQVGYA